MDPAKLSVSSAVRVAETIGVLKWLLILLTGAGVLALGMISLIDDGEITKQLLIVSTVGGLVSMLTTYVFFGWFEHSLLMLARIASR